MEGRAIAGLAFALADQGANEMTNHPVVLIAGALTGIGRAAAFAFARENARSVV